jgi:hypothetical protein
MSDAGSGREPQTPADPSIYRPHIATAFSIDASPSPVVLTLSHIDDAGVTAGLHQFSLFFHGAPERLLPPNTYLLHHDALGPVLLFITPVQGSTRERILYEACFNVHVQPADPR